MDEILKIKYFEVAESKEKGVYRQSLENKIDTVLCLLSQRCLGRQRCDSFKLLTHGIFDDCLTLLDPNKHIFLCYL